MAKKKNKAYKSYAQKMSNLVRNFYTNGYLKKVNGSGIRYFNYTYNRMKIIMNMMIHVNKFAYNKNALQFGLVKTPDFKHRWKHINKDQYVYFNSESKVNILIFDIDNDPHEKYEDQESTWMPYDVRVGRVYSDVTMLAGIAPTYVIKTERGYHVGFILGDNYDNDEDIHNIKKEMNERFKSELPEYKWDDNASTRVIGFYRNFLTHVGYYDPSCIYFKSDLINYLKGEVSLEGYIDFFAKNNTQFKREELKELFTSIEEAQRAFRDREFMDKHMPKSKVEWPNKKTGDVKTKFTVNKPMEEAEVVNLNRVHLSDEQLIDLIASEESFVAGNRNNYLFLMGRIYGSLVSRDYDRIKGFLNKVNQYCSRGGVEPLSEKEIKSIAKSVHGYATRGKCYFKLNDKNLSPRASKFLRSRMKKETTKNLGIMKEIFELEPVYGLNADDYEAMVHARKSLAGKAICQARRTKSVTIIAWALIKHADITDLTSFDKYSKLTLSRQLNNILSLTSIKTYFNEAVALAKKIVNKHGTNKQTYDFKQILTDMVDEVLNDSRFQKVFYRCVLPRAEEKFSKPIYEPI